jgi:hypothetical protein
MSPDFAIAQNVLISSSDIDREITISRMFSKIQNAKSPSGFSKLC